MNHAHHRSGLLVGGVNQPGIRRRASLHSAVDHISNCQEQERQRDPSAHPKPWRLTSSLGRNPFKFLWLLSSHLIVPSRFDARPPCTRLNTTGTKVSVATVA